MKNLFAKTLALFLICLSCISQEKKVKSIVASHNQPVEITYSDKSVEIIYSDSMGKNVKQIIDKNAKETLKDSLINSLSIGIYINNVSYNFHYGELTKGKGNVATNETIYEIASVTKTFTGTLASKAVLEGKLSLEDDIREYLPKTYPNLEYNGQPIKIKHLLTHTSGLPGEVIILNNKIDQNLNEIEFNKIVVEHENKKTKPIFFESLSEINLTEKPGTTFNYSNAGTNLMGYILEKVYKEPFQKLIMNEVVAKAQMKDTYFHTPKNKQYRLANGYLLGTPMPESKLANTLWGAEGALKSTIPDMLKYIHYQLKNNSIVEESHKKLFEIGPDYWIGYLWWSIEDQNYDLHYRHDGGISRVKNVLAIFPKKKIGISIFTNESSIKVNQKLNDLTHKIYNDLN
ncbi:serine hydrolase domain-containing protein [uncultured Aquimarina sp.]|uniref:serine hydrolase domain-containing protein n=1 Tax=uncultured Aquimarina sp. TaxID=575652 RepID=UPI0026296172|nr:serine hydrolase domain-containing protein [uncultured Aquimarina sp.]